MSSSWICPRCGAINFTGPTASNGCGCCGYTGPTPQIILTTTTRSLEEISAELNGLEKEKRSQKESK